MFLNWFQPTRRQRQSARQHRHARRPCLETLEDRCLPTTLTVLNANDAGSGSLPDRIASAVSGDTIDFAPALIGQTITLTSGQLAITKNLNIVGPGASKLAISGNASSRVFDVASGDSLVLEGLTITKGMADQGGGIQNAGTLTVNGCVLDNNEALGDSSTSGVGGGIFNKAGAVLALNHCTVSNNQVVGSNLGLGFGGGLMNEGQATVAGTRFTGNTASGGATSFGSGGAISNQTNAKLTITGSSFMGNLARDGLGTSARGGAVDNEQSSSLAVSKSDFTGNAAQAITATLSDADGGAIECGASKLSITSCRFVGNLASGFFAAQGGAIEVQPGGPATISKSLFAYNQAKGIGPGGGGDAGAVFNGDASMSITGSTFTGNQAVGTPGADGDSRESIAWGGAIWNGGEDPDVFATLTVSSSTFTGNQALGGGGHIDGTSSFAIASGEAGGGAIEDNQGGKLFISNSTLTGNQAIGGSGGHAVNGGVGQGGGIDIALQASATVRRCTLSDNLALGGAGVRGGHGGNGLGGAIAVGALPDAFSDLSTSTLTLSGSTLTDNLAEGGTGAASPAGAPGGNGGSGLGGGLFIGLLGARSASSMTVSQTLFAGNQAVGGPGGLGTNGGDGDGGGIYAASGTTCLDHVTIGDNVAVGGSSGGGTAGHGVGGGMYIDALATAGGGKHCHILGNLASTSDDDVFGVLNPNC
jgi:hypothetical protein